MVLRKGGAGGTIVDVIGQVGADPGAEWGAGLTSTADNTLRRKSSVTDGDTNAGDAFDPSIQWDGFANDTFGGLGSHTIDTTGNAPIVPTCPANLTTPVGTPASTVVRAADADGTVVNAAITSPPVVSITLDNVAPAPSAGGVLTATLNVSGSLASGTYTTTITFSNDDPAPQTATCTVLVRVETPGALKAIGVIQGAVNDLSTLQSPFAGQSVTTEGVITVVLGTGFFVQDPTGDGNVATSDGIFVFTNSIPTVAPGDRVRVAGTVVEFRGNNRPDDLTLTEIGDPGLSVTPLGTAPLPAPVAVDAPNEQIAPDGIVYWERLEGMYVTLGAAVVTGATIPTFGELVVVAGPDATPGSGFHPTGNIVVRDLPGDDVDYNPERLVVDDESRVGGGNNARIVAAGAESSQVRLSVGDTFSSLAGVVDYQFSLYRLQPASDPEATVAQRQGKPPVGSGGIRAPTSKELSIASLNMESFMDAVNDPNKADSPILTPAQVETKAAKLTIAVADELKCPDIVVAVEIENALVLTGDGDGQVPGTDAAALAPRLAARGCPYAAVSREATDDRSIEVGFLYRTDRNITLTSYYLTTVGDADTPPKPDDDLVFIGGGQFSDSREPLVGEFVVDGKPLTIIGNHWASKGGDGPLYGVTQPPTRSSEAQRKLQAQYVREYLDESVFAADPLARVLIAGDLNDFAFPEPGEGVDPVTIVKGSGATRLINLIDQVPEDNRYSYVFQGNSQVLDHILVSSQLWGSLTEINIAHFDANFGTLYANDATVASSVSDHDSALARFDAELDLLPRPVYLGIIMR